MPSWRILIAVQLVGCGVLLAAWKPWAVFLALLIALFGLAMAQDDGAKRGRSTLEQGKG